MDISTIEVNRLWAKAINSIINWTNSLTSKELREMLDFLKLLPEGDYMKMRWRLARYHQHCRHMDRKWEESGRVRSLEIPPDKIFDWEKVALRSYEAYQMIRKPYLPLSIAKIEFYPNFPTVQIPANHKSLLLLEVSPLPVIM